jgi:hypothetical protein
LTHVFCRVNMNGGDDGDEADVVIFHEVMMVRLLVIMVLRV